MVQCIKNPKIKRDINNCYAITNNLNMYQEVLVVRIYNRKNEF